MPVKVRKRRASEGGKLWKIVEARTGRIVGQSETKQKASRSAAIRNAYLPKR